MKFNDSVSEADVRKYLSYDPATGIFTRLVGTGKGAQIGATAGTKTVKGYVTISLRQRRTFAHRLAFVFMTGSYPDGIVDHINGDKSDNRWANLRVADKVSNAGNAHGHRDAQIPLKGVSPAPNKKFRASIGVGGRQIHLGTFSDPLTAHAAYAKAAAKHFKEFAKP